MATLGHGTEMRAGDCDKEHGHGVTVSRGHGDKGHGAHPPCPRRVPAVLEILELIQRRELVAADAQIIALEAECSLSPSRPPSPCPLPASPSSGSPPPSPSPAGGRRERDVALLYRALLAQLWAVVAEAVAAGRAVAPLRAVVAVLEQEEAADARSPPGTRPGRPRGLRRRWHEAVARAASERLAQVAPAGGLGARLAALAARVVGDLGVVRSHVAPAYPPEYGALGVYARGYHRALAQQLRALAQRPLDVPDLYLLLDWHSNAYPREVLGHPEVGALLRAQALGPLLPPETQRDLESSCISAVKAKVEVAVAQELQLSEDTWPEDVTSQDMEDGLATRVTGPRSQCHPPVPQVLLSELHRRVLIEYVRPLLQGRLVCASAKSRARVAARLGDEARQLRELFTRLLVRLLRGQRGVSGGGVVTRFGDIPCVPAIVPKRGDGIVTRFGDIAWGL
ncbi:exocyst complex component 3-like protein 4 [Malurus melanocephalus]|nr:exocyst complex component 3-like protein 4 [Malurus melanocephalus]